MLEVRFRNTWFAATSLRRISKLQSTSGQRFAPGVHKLPDEVEEYLPKSATIIRRSAEAMPEDEIGSAANLKEFDVARTAAEQEASIRARADAEVKVEGLEVELEAEKDKSAALSLQVAALAEQGALMTPPDAEEAPEEAPEDKRAAFKAQLAAEEADKVSRETETEPKPKRGKRSAK